MQLAHNTIWRGGGYARGGGGGGRQGRQGRRGRGRGGGRGGRGGGSPCGFVSRTSLALEAKNSERELPQYARIGLKEELGKALERIGAVIIEFPTIHIALPSEIASYTAKGADDDEVCPSTYIYVCTSLRRKIGRMSAHRTLLLMLLLSLSRRFLMGNGEQWKENGFLVERRLESDSGSGEESSEESDLDNERSKDNDGGGDDSSIAAPIAGNPA